MNPSRILSAAIVTAVLLVGINFAQEPATKLAASANDSQRPGVASSQEQIVFEKTEPAEPSEAAAASKPPIVKTDGTPAKVEDVPKPAAVKETQPAGTPVPPPDDKPELSSPVPSPQGIATPPVRYFVLIFGSESAPKRARFCHTWFTIVKATPKANQPSMYDPEGAQVQYYDLTAHTISWLPASMHIRVIKLRAERGCNFSLHKTIQWACNGGQNIGLWGPYEVNPLVAEELYDRSIKQIQRLNSGAVLYKAIDPDRPPASLRIADCIHAVSDMDGPGRRSNYDEFQRFGFDASRHLACVMIRANRLDGGVTHEWIAEALELNRYPIRRQKIIVPKPDASPMTAGPSPSPGTGRR